MQDNGSGNSEERPHEPSETTESPSAVAVADHARESSPDAREPSPAAPPSRPGRTLRLAAYVAAGALAVGVGFGLARAIGSPGAPGVPSAIPSPAKTGGVFVEDDDGTAQDSQTNILQSTAPGLVHIISGGKSVGIGMVLTPSGKVLTTYQPTGGTGSLEAKYVVSGVTFKAKVIGTNVSAGLALLQLEGANGRAFSTLQVGNSATIADDTYGSRQVSYHLPGEVFDTAVGTTGTQDALTINTGTLIALNTTSTVDGKTKTGLLESALQASPVTEIGGPLVNLNGQVIGITVGGQGSGLRISGYAMPINQALAIATQIDAKARPAS
jgi:S1-C subfamily serine protease